MSWNDIRRDHLESLASDLLDREAHARTLAVAVEHRDDYCVLGDLQVLECGPYGHQVLLGFRRVGNGDERHALIDIDQARQLVMALGAELEIVERTIRHDPAVEGAGRCNT